MPEQQPPPPRRFDEPHLTGGVHAANFRPASRLAPIRAHWTVGPDAGNSFLIAFHVERFGMKPLFPSRWFLLFAWLGASFGVLTLAGCLGPLFRSKDSKDVESLIEDESDDEGPRYVGHLTLPWGFDFARIEGVALITQLQGTGSSPRPDALRKQLVGEMLTHEVRDTESVLDAPDTALALVRATLRPGIEKGERFDIEVRVPSKSETTSLAGGYLMRTRLRPIEILGGTVKSGHIVGLAQGPLIVDSAFDGDADPVLKTRGVVLGGGVSTISRSFGLHVRGKYQSVNTSTAIAKAINARFVANGKYRRGGAAVPKTNKIIELSAPRQYSNNLGRFVRVVSSLVIGETPQEEMKRVQVLERQLLEPTTSSRAALRLEAVGSMAVNVLLSATSSPNAEVRFYAAESLAYLKRPEAVGVLEATARNMPRLRWHALTALSCMDDVEAGVALTSLLESNSAETAYGAFRALRARSESDPVVRGDILGDGFSFHVIATEADPIIHFSRARRPEIVLFGRDHRLNENFLYRGGEWVIRGTSPGTIKVSRFSVGEDGKHEVCGNGLVEIVRAIDRLGGGYRDVLELVKRAKESGRLNSRLVVNAVAAPGRRYQRRKNTTQEDSTGGFPSLLAATPLPELFRDRQEGKEPRSKDEDASELREEGGQELAKPKKSLLGRIKGWFAS